METEKSRGEKEMQHYFSTFEGLPMHVGTGDMNQVFGHGIMDFQLGASPPDTPSTPCPVFYF